MRLQNSKTGSIKKWLMVGTLVSGLAMANLTFADDSSSSNFCASYSNPDNGDGSGDSGSQCCSSAMSALCQIDTDITTGFSNITDLINKLFVTATDMTTTITSVISNTSASMAYIDNDDMNTSVSTNTNNDINTLMNNDAQAQLEIAKQFAQQLPSSGTGSFNVNNFSISSLMNEPGIESSKQPDVLNMIKTLANYGSPVKNLDANYAKQTSNTSVIEFQSSLGAYNAAQSNALNALYRIAQERTIVSGLSSSAGVPNGQEISPWQLDEYNVYQALNAAKNGSLADANVVELLRASYLDQAGMQYELFKNRQELQQLNATMAVIQLQLLNSIDKNTLNQQRLKAVK